jgi:hypothetical protein
MEVFEELVKGTFDELKGLEPLYEHDVERALEAVLPKVRERLLSEMARERAREAQEDCFERNLGAASFRETSEAVIKAAFDAAFPEDS